MTLEDFFTLTEVKDGITSLSRIEELITVMQKEKDCVVNTSEAIGQWTAVANTIATTESRDCLDLFVKLGGLQFIDKWLKDAGDLGGKAEDSCVEESITAFLLALEKLCIDKGGVVPPGIHVILIKLFGHSSLKVQNRAREVFNKLKLSDRDTICDNFVNTELVNHGSQGSSDPEASVQVEKQIVDNSAEKKLSETSNGIGPEKLQNEVGVEGETSDLPPLSLDHEGKDHEEQKCKLEEISAGETGKDDVVVMVDKRDSCHENLTVTEASAAIHEDEQGGVPSSIVEFSKENREVLSSMEKVEEQNNGSSADETMKSASPGSTGRIASPEESKSLAVEEDKENIGTEQENETEKGICGFDLNEEVGSDDLDCKDDKTVSSEEGKQERNVSLDFDLNRAEVGEGEEGSFAGLNPGRLEKKLELDLNSAGEEDDDDDVVFLGSRMNKQMLDHQNSNRYAYASSSAQLHHFQMNLSLNGQPFSRPKSDPFISIMGTKVAIQKEEEDSHVANGSAVPTMNRSDWATTGPSYSMPFMMNSSGGSSRPQIELNLGCGDGGYHYQDPPGVYRQFIPSASEEHRGSLSGSIVGTKRKEPDGGLVLYP